MAQAEFNLGRETGVRNRLPPPASLSRRRAQSGGRLFLSRFWILPPVFATPVMIMVMENAALNAIRAYLDPGGAQSARPSTCATSRRRADMQIPPD
jgi:hypothetical protein